MTADTLWTALVLARPAWSYRARSMKPLWGHTGDEPHSKRALRPR